MRKLMTVPGLLLLSLSVLGASCGGIPDDCDPANPETCIPDPEPAGPYACEAGAAAALSVAEAEPFEVSATGRYIVRRTGAARRGIAQLRTSYTSMSNVVTLGSVNGFACSMSAADAERLHAEAGVIVEPDGIKSIPAPPPRSPGVSDLGPLEGTRVWTRDRHDQRALPLDGEWLPGGHNGAGVRVCIIDTGISEHVDYQGRLAPGVSFVGGTPADGHGHGTHVASSVGGGQFGIAPGVTLVPVRVLNAQGSGSDSGVIQGIEWAADNCAIANMSLGGDTSDALDAALCTAKTSGLAFAVAAGNDGLGACKYSPARNAGAVTAGATGKRDNVPSWSNFGPCLQLWSGGEDVLGARRGGGETTMSGTSMASPQIAGALARLKAELPDATVDELYQVLLERATPGVIDLSESPDELLFVGTP